MAEDLLQKGLIEFNRALGPRVSTRKAQDLLSNFLKNTEGSEASFRGFVDKFPPNVKGKAFELIDQYAGMRGAPSAASVEQAPVTDPVEFDKPFRAELDFDPSKNAWYDRPYNMRYANSPKVQAFLQDKESLLNRKGDYVAAQASQGNIEPFIQHQRWLSKQGVLPSDAQSFRDYYTPFNRRYGSEVDTDRNFLNDLHDLDAHAIPEAFMGVVDKTFPGGITGADENRAALLEGLMPEVKEGELMTQGDVGVANTVIERLKELQKINPNLTDYDSLNPSVLSVLEKPGTPSYFFHSIGDSDNTSAESKYFTDRYSDEVKQANLKTPYGTKLAIDPYNEGLVSDPKGSYVSDLYKEASLRRLPPSKPSDMLSFVENAAKPYVADLEKFRKLSLLDKFTEAYATPERFSGTEDVDAVNRIFDNTYFSLDPVTTAAKGLRELARGIRKTPSALLPGRADLIPSAGAVRTGFQQGPVAMGKQMATEFIKGIPGAIAPAGVLALRAAAPFAPGVGAGMVTTAATEAVNEAVKQQTGEGIVPKLRQTFGTAPRTGVADRSAPVTTNLQRAIGTPAVQNGKTVYWAGSDYGWQSGPSFNKVRDQVISRETVPAVGRNSGSRPAVVPQIRPLNQVQRDEVQRQQSRNRLQENLDLARERFNPSKLEFGVSELLFGR